MDDPLLYLLLIVLIALSAFFSSAETAFSSISKVRLKHYEDIGRPGAKKAIYIQEHFDDALSAILIGNNIVNIASASIGTIIFTDLVGPKWGPGLSTAAMTVVVLIFGEVLPKTYAKEYADKVALGFSRVLFGIMAFFKPLVFVLVKLKGVVMRLLGSQNDLPSVTEEELKYIIEEIEDEGVLEQHESELIQSALEFSDVTVSEILTPRVDMVGVSQTAAVEEVKELFLTERFSRLPVYEKTADNIVGIINNKDFFAAYLENPEFPLSAITQEVIFVPPKKPIGDLLKEFQKAREQMAVVIDQYGGTLGIITLEDILEELVGEIWDKDDEAQSEFTEEGEGLYSASGDARLDDLMEVIAPSLTLEEGHAMTLSGWILDKLERLPAAGESFEIDGLTITVQDVQEQRLLRIRIMVPAELRSPKEEG
ncbi:MAG: HlyC/CorC family transporter [Oscillospiraceae bacterium]|nr:HlyC/CorC family transporter [Oscillospiraceae bacterium]